MGQLNCSSQACSRAAKLPQRIVCIATTGGDLPSGGAADRGSGGEPSIGRKGLNIWAESAHDLLRALPFELDADTDHLHASVLEDGLGAQGCGPFEQPDFARDVGVCCEGAGDSASPSRCKAQAGNQDNYACVQVDDAANPWGLYAVADGQGPEGHLVSTLLVHELPGLLALNPGLHRHAGMALHQAFVAVGEMASSCQFVDASRSGGTLSAALLRPGLLYVAWVGDSKVVLGRSMAGPGSMGELGAQTAASTVARYSSGPSPRAPAAASAPSCKARTASGPGGTGAPRTDRPKLQPTWPLPRMPPELPPGRRQPPGLPPAPEHRQQRQQACGPNLAPYLRAVELTLDHAVADGLATDAADGAGGPAMPLEGLPRCFGNSSLQKPNAGDAGGGSALPCQPEVRRMKLKPEDCFVVLGTSGLWGHLSPDEAVALVGRNLHRMAADAAEALQVEAVRRAALAGPHRPMQDITAIVVYLAGRHAVTEFSPWRATHVPEHRREALVLRHLQQSGCPAGLWCGSSGGDRGLAAWHG